MMRGPIAHPIRFEHVTSSWSPDGSGDELAGEPLAAARPPYRPPIGIPVPRERRVLSTLVSVALHVLVILLLLAPVVGPSVLQEVQGAGGEGPAGGGGGGTLGTGGRQGLGVVERLHYIQVAPPAPVAAPQPVPPPEKKSEPTPVVTPPPVTPPVAKPAAPPPTTPAADQSASAATAPTPGSGGGTGADGTAGSGPGTGGGIGSGAGTGRGAGIGPGTGGGTASIFPPQARELFLPPWPVPDKVKGTQLVAVFDVDSTGAVLSFEFTPTKDGGYNRKLKEVLGAVKFRPATRADGQPVRAKGSLTYVF
jgi:periplasmic protein TonB